MDYFDQGDVVRCSLALTSSAGAAVDPGGLTFYVRAPSGLTTYVYGTNVELVKDSIGHYHVDVTIPKTGEAIAGKWVYRFEASGANQGAEEGEFVVRNSGIYG